MTALGLTFDLWHDPEDRAYASDGRRSLAVRSKAFKTLLVARFRDATGGKVPNAEALATAQLAIEGVAVHDRSACNAHVRVAEAAGRVYVHLADDHDTVIEIDASGWRECAVPPVRFVRAKGMRPLPRPRPGGCLDDVRRVINVPDDAPFALVRAWLAQAFLAGGPFPLLVLLGEQGTAKTTTARVLKRLTDPRAADARAEPKDVRDLMIAARGSWALCYDNLSGLPAWLSDALCRLATGGGFSTRELFTDDEEMTFEAKRPVILNGIEEFVTRADLLERSVLIHHPPIPENRRRTEAAVWAEFAALAPGLLGALFDYIAGGLRVLPTLDTPALPRMADFARFAVACEVARAGDGGAFLAAYRENQAGANEQVLDTSPVAAAVQKLMVGKAEWVATASDLLESPEAVRPRPAGPGLAEAGERAVEQAEAAGPEPAAGGRAGRPDRGEGHGQESEPAGPHLPPAGRGPGKIVRTVRVVRRAGFPGPAGGRSRGRGPSGDRPPIVRRGARNPAGIRGWGRSGRCGRSFPEFLRSGGRPARHLGWGPKARPHMSPSALIMHCRDLGITLTPALDFDGPADALGEDVIALIRSQKPALLRLLVGPPGADQRGDPGPDWRAEWVREAGLLALRCRNTTDTDVQDRLRSPLAETPRALTEWLILGEMIRDAEYDLRRAGKQPPVPNYDP